MSSEAEAEKAPETKAETPAAGSVAKKASPIVTILTIVLTAVFAAGASYAGSLKAGKGGGGGGGDHHGAEDAHGGGHGAAKPPGPTLPLDPFLVTLFDAKGRNHPMKLSIAVEFDAHTKEDLKTFTPRIRDAVITHLRAVPFEQVADHAHIEKLRTELIEKCKAAGATTAERVLVTDFVVQ